MIKTNELDLVVRCESCEELKADESGVVSTVPLEDVATEVEYRLEFFVRINSDGSKTIKLRHLYDPDGNDQLGSLDESVSNRLEQLVERILAGGVCGNLPQCPDSIKTMQNSAD